MRRPLLPANDLVPWHAGVLGPGRLGQACGRLSGPYHARHRGGIDVRRAWSGDHGRGLQRECRLGQTRTEPNLRQGRGTTGRCRAVQRLAPIHRRAARPWNPRRRFICTGPRPRPTTSTIFSCGRRLSGRSPASGSAVSSTGSGRVSAIICPWSSISVWRPPRPGADSSLRRPALPRLGPSRKAAHSRCRMRSAGCGCRQTSGPAASRQARPAGRSIRGRPLLSAPRIR
jgi:hypothetical protein